MGVPLPPLELPRASTSTELTSQIEDPFSRAQGPPGLPSPSFRSIAGSLVHRWKRARGRAKIDALGYSDSLNWRTEGVRQHWSGARWEEGDPSAASRRGERQVGRGQILELPDPGHLLHRERLRPQEGEWREAGPLSGGQIVEDRLDGLLVYQEPPRRGRTVHRLRRLLDRVSPPMWFFVLLVWAQASTALVDVLSSGDWSASSVANLALRLGYTCAVTLLPAGVLIWRSDAWRSARLVLLGAIVWTTLPAIAGLVWWIVRRSPGLMDQFGYAWAVVVAVVAVVAYVGPAIVAFGLERARRNRMQWLPYLAQRAAVVTALVTLFNAVRWLPLARNTSIQPLGGGIDSLHLAGSVSGAALPLELLCLLILACSCLSAVLAGEAQSRLWQCAAVGATLLAGASLFELSAGNMLGSVATSGLAGRTWDTAAATAILLAGSGLMFLAFASPVWSAARDAEGFGRGAPDEIFSWGAGAEANGSEPIPMITIVAVAAGTDHALALDQQGYVGAWGDDSVGQTDVPDGLSGVIAMAAGDGFSLALRSDGTVVAWGANNLGQTTVPHDLTAVTAIAAGSGFSLALRADGTVVGWGDGHCGATTVPSGLASVTAISAGEYHGLGLRLDGTIVAWGDNSHGQSDVPPGLMRVRSISAGGDFSLALLTNGTIVAWGDNSYGQLDVPAGLKNVTAISAGAFHALALRADGDVIGWGGGGQKRGEAAHPWRLVDFKAVAAGDGFSLAIRAA